MININCFWLLNINGTTTRHREWPNSLRVKQHFHHLSPIWHLQRATVLRHYHWSGTSQGTPHWTCLKDFKGTQGLLIFLYTHTYTDIHPRTHTHTHTLTHRQCCAKRTNPTTFGRKTTVWQFSLEAIFVLNVKAEFVRRLKKSSDQYWKTSCKKHVRVDSGSGQVVGFSESHKDIKHAATRRPQWFATWHLQQ